MPDLVSYRINPEMVPTEVESAVAVLGTALAKYTDWQGAQVTFNLSLTVPESTIDVQVFNA